MGDFRQLFQQQTADLERSAASWRSLAEHCSTEQERHGQLVTGVLRAAEWKGEAATVGFSVLDAVETQLGVVRSQATSIATVVDTFHTEIAIAREQLRTVVREAEESGFTVDDDGRVTANFGRTAANDPDYASTIGVRQTGYQARLNTVLEKADTASTAAARLLREFVPALLDKPEAAQDALSDARAVLDARPVCAPLPDSMSPERAARWWAALSEEDQALYLAAYPEEIGRTDGLPIAARDQANRSIMDGRISELTLRGGEETAAELASLTQLRERMDRNHGGPVHSRPYLIGLDTEGDGQAIVSVGNPDTAKNTAVFIPGTGANLGGVSGDIDRVENLVRASNQFDRPGETAAVMWLGYDAPDDVFPGATESGYANEGGPALADYFEGLRASHEIGDASITAVGHSYGSTVLGNAARTDDGIPVDDIIVAGSPGMQVSYAAELNISPERVWAAEADGDSVPKWGQAFHGGAEYQGWGRWEINHPTDEGFGANRITTSTSGHSDYWEKGTEDLANQAKIITGHHEDVKLEWEAKQ